MTVPICQKQNMHFVFRWLQDSTSDNLFFFLKTISFVVDVRRKSRWQLRNSQICTHRNWWMKYAWVFVNLLNRVLIIDFWCCHVLVLPCLQPWLVNAKHGHIKDVLCSSIFVQKWKTHTILHDGTRCYMKMLVIDHCSCIAVADLVFLRLGRQYNRRLTTYYLVNPPLQKRQKNEKPGVALPTFATPLAHHIKHRVTCWVG